LAVGYLIYESAAPLTNIIKIKNVSTPIENKEWDLISEKYIEKKELFLMNIRS
jgi:hypothetical protein